MADEDQRTISRERRVFEDCTWEPYWQGHTTARAGDWRGPTPQDVIELMNHDLGPQPESAYRVVEGTT